MLPHEIQAAIAGNSQLQGGYQRMLDWINQGGKHGSYAGLIPNEAVVRSAMTPWGENIQYDAQGNEVSFYRSLRPGETSPYQGPAGPSAPEYDPAKSRAAFVPEAFKQKSINAALAGAQPSIATRPAVGGLDSPSLLAALAQQPQETEEERLRRLAREAQLGVQ